MTARKTFGTIDIAKFVASILIFSMHCGALNDYEYAGFILQLLSRWGVPFFFICSSYFLFSKSVNGKLDKSTIYAYIYRIATLYFIWFIYNLPNVIHQRLYHKDLSALSTWLICVKESLLYETFTGSWFLMSSIFSAWFVNLLSKKFPTFKIMLMTLPLYLICVTSSAYHGLLPTNIARIFDFLCFPLNIFTGCFYFALGKFIYENESKIKVFISQKKAIILFFVFYIFFAAEIIIAKHLDIYGSTDAAISTVFIAFFLFLFCIQTTAKIKNGLLLRKLSTIIYCCQGNVLLVNIVCQGWLGFSSVLAYLICVLIVAVIAILVLYIQKKWPWRWVRYLT